MPSVFFDQQQNFLNKANFYLLIHRIPNTLFYVQKCNIPGLNLGNAMQPTPLIDNPLPGDKLEYTELNVSFLVDEHLLSYEMLFNWITGLGFPATHQQFAELKQNWLETMKYPALKNELEKIIGRHAALAYDQSEFQFSEATLHVVSSNYNKEVAEFRFINLFPVSLSPLDFDTTITTTENIQCDVSFKFSEMQVKFFR